MKSETHTPQSHATHPVEYRDFASTTWFNQSYDMLQEHLSRNLISSLVTYPEKDCLTLRTMVARRNSLSADNVLFAAGRTGCFYAIAEAFAGKTCTIFTPSFAQYEAAARKYGCTIRFVPNTLSTDEIDLSDSAFCWIASPNTPDGKFRSREEIFRLIAANPSVVFILDQAFVTFTTLPSLSLSDVKQYPNLIIVRSFSHAYSLPGLRIGYMAMGQELASQIATKVEPWNISSLAIEAAKYILIHPAQFTLPIRKWQRNAQELMNKLKLIDGLEVVPSDTTFFLVRFENRKASEVVERLKEEYHILVRDISGFQGLSDEYVRITARLEEENNLLVEAVKEVLTH